MAAMEERGLAWASGWAELAPVRALESASGSALEQALAAAWARASELAMAAEVPPGRPGQP